MRVVWANPLNTPALELILHLHLQHHPSTIYGISQPIQPSHTWSHHTKRTCPSSPPIPTITPAFQNPFDKESHTLLLFFPKPLVPKIYASIVHHHDPLSFVLVNSIFSTLAPLPRASLHKSSLRENCHATILPPYLPDTSPSTPAIHFSPPFHFSKPYMPHPISPPILAIWAIVSH